MLQLSVLLLLLLVLKFIEFIAKFIESVIDIETHHQL